MNENFCSDCRHLRRAGGAYQCRASVTPPTPHERHVLGNKESIARCHDVRMTMTAYENCTLFEQAKEAALG